MKKPLALLCTFLLVFGPHLYAGKQDFTLVNKTGFDLHEVYVAPHGSDDWQEDVLGGTVLAKDATVKIKFERQIKGQDWDLKVVDKAGKGTTWEKLNLLEISKITLHFDGGKATAEVE